MKIDLGTIALILIISNVILSIFIFVQAISNKKYNGIKQYSMGNILFSAAFLFLFLKDIVHYDLIAALIGNLLILFAMSFQYVGIMKFILGRVNYSHISIILFFSAVLLSYFTYKDNIEVRLAVIACSVSTISFLFSFGLLKKNINKSIFQTKSLGLFYLFVGFLSLLYAVYSLFYEHSDDITLPQIFKILSFTIFFIVTFITALGFNSIINMRLRSDINESKGKFEEIFNLSPDAAVITSYPDGKIVNYNRRFLDYYGFNDNEVAGRDINDLNIYEDRNAYRNILQTLKEKGYIVNYETTFVRKDGKKIVCIISFEKITINNLPHIIGFAHDITERKNTENNLKNSEEKYKFLTEFASDVTWVYDLSNNRYNYVSPSVFELRGFTSEEAVTESFEDSFTPETFPILKELIAKNIKTISQNHNSSEYFISEVQQPCKNGNNIWTEISLKYNITDNGDIEIFGVSRNIEKRKRFEKQVVYLSYHDQLTGLYNRRFYEEELKRINVTENLPIAFVMIDVNGLKLINDAFGHISGDILLEKVANVFKAEYRDNEIFARIGGDEFIAILLKTSVEAAKYFIIRIRNAVAKEKIYDISLSISIGFAIKNDIIEDINKVINKAENDMYRNKLSERLYLRNTSITTILNLVYKKNSFEKNHSIRVQELCGRIAKELNWNEEDVNEIRLAGLMHDIGKIGVDDSIINKPSKLTDFEYSEIKKHSETGFRILSSSSEFERIAEYVLEHHERWDGKGYPRGLRGEEISIQARIITLADSYDVMKSERSYCNNRSDNEAVIEIKKCAGAQFDPNLSKLFVEKILKKIW